MKSLEMVHLLFEDFYGAFQGWFQFTKRRKNNLKYFCYNIMWSSSYRKYNTAYPGNAVKLS